MQADVHMIEGSTVDRSWKKIEIIESELRFKIFDLYF